MRKKIQKITAVISAALLAFSVYTNGILPLAENNTQSTINTLSQEKTYLIPGGQAFGVKMYTNGVLVVELSDFKSEDGNVCPAKTAGIKTSDTIVSINGTKITSNEEISDIVKNSNGDVLTVTGIRNGEIYSTEITPQKCISQNEYKIGLWVRDSTAGIGTITYYNPANSHIGGLGHGISDITTGTLMPAASGQLIGAEILSVAKGEKGSPGQLEGALNSSIIYGSLLDNSDKGIFALSDSDFQGEAIEIASENEIEIGDATIYATVSSDIRKEYTVKIESINRLTDSGKNMVIKITDPELLEITGGIVQGMSGSPIMQNGKLIGAITHVFVNDPTHGYGVFIENMLAEDN